MSEALHYKYRPMKFKDVVGQNAIIRSLTSVVDANSSQAFLFAGPSGVGKTTLARITAHDLGCEEKDILEIQAAVYTGVDDMRGVIEGLRYKPFGKGEVKAVILDECHMLSKSAWNALLKVLEEPPEHIYWFLCTTEVGRVPATVQTRCVRYTLSLVPEKLLEELCERVCEAEGIELPGEVVTLVVKEAHGSPRQLLVNLAACREVKTKKEAAETLKTAIESDATLELCRFLVKGGSWLKAMVIIEKLKDQNPESIRIVVANYMAAALKKSTKDRDAAHFLTILESFSESYNSSDGMAPLFLSIGRVIFGEEE